MNSKGLLLLSLKKRGLLALVFLFCINALTDQSTIMDFHLTKCIAKKCFEIKAKKAQTSLIANQTSFSHIEVIVVTKGLKNNLESKSTWKSEDAFYNQQTEELFLRKVKKGKHSDLIIDLVTGKLTES